MPGTSAKTAEVKLRVPIELASAIETYAQAHTHGNKTRAYLHFLEAGITAQSDQAPVTKADLLAVAAAMQATVQRSIASQQLPALPSPEAFAQNIEESVSRSVAKHMAATSETVATQIAARIPNLDNLENLEKIGEAEESQISRAYQRGFVAGKEAEDRRAIAVAMGMNSLMRTVSGGPFIRAFLPNAQAELFASDLPETSDAQQATTTERKETPEKSEPKEKKDVKPAQEPEHTPRHVAVTGEEAGVKPIPLFAEASQPSSENEITGVLPPVQK